MSEPAFHPGYRLTFDRLDLPAYKLVCNWHGEQPITHLDECAEIAECKRVSRKALREWSEDRDALLERGIPNRWFG